MSEKEILGRLAIETYKRGLGEVAEDGSHRMEWMKFTL